MHFYLPQLNGRVRAEESAHFFSCRVQNGEILTLTDLQGRLVEAKITLIDKKTKQLKYEILQEIETEKPPERILFQAITDKSYQEKLVELLPFAFTKIYWIVTKNSVFKQVNLERLNKILIRSCEQSQTCFLPRMEILNSKMEQILTEFQPVILDTSGDKKCEALLNFPILIGPEGGWAKEELQLFEKLKLQKLSLGEKVYPAWLAGFVASQKIGN